VPPARATVRGVARPYVLFAIGWGSKLAWTRGWMEYLAPEMVARGLLASAPREGEDWGAFDWGRPSCFVASVARPTGSAARALAASLPARDEITLIGHSKAGNLVLEYLAQVAEGRLPAHPGLRRAIVLNAPVDNVAARAALAHISQRRLAGLEARLAARGVDARVQLAYDPTDPVSRAVSLEGVRCVAHVSGAPCPPSRIGSLQFWHPNHLACFRDGWAELLAALSAV
jgi:hypothetical protein